MLRLADPWWLLLFLPLLFAVWWQAKQVLKVRIRFPVTHLMHSIGFAMSGGRLEPRWWLRSLALLLMCVAMARPQLGEWQVSETKNALDINLVVDTSGSMEAMDFTLNGERVDRLSALKDVTDKFIQKRKQDRIGLVVFGTEAYVQAPLTFDHELLRTIMKKVRIGMAGGNTAIGDALALAVKRIKDVPSRSKIIILLTDGSSNAGKIEPLEAAEAAQSFAIKVYPIAIGTGGVAPFLVDGFFGKALENRPVELDEDALKKIAQITGGTFYQAASTEEWQQIFAAIDALEKTPQQAPQFKAKREFYPWLLGLALVALLGEGLLLLRPTRRLPL